MILPAMYAYGREIQETRYLYVLFPIFCVISVYGLNIFKKIDKTKYVFSILVIIILSSIFLLDYTQTDQTFNYEILQVSKFIVENVDGVNDYPGSSYVKIATLEQNWPNSLPIDERDKVSFYIKKFPARDYSSLETFLLDNKDSGLTHIVLSEQNHSTFLDELVINYESYSYLEKVFDSKDYKFENNMIVLKINYSSFEKME